MSDPGPQGSRPSMSGPKDRLDLLLRQHAHLFTDSNDGMSGFEADIRVGEGATPVFCKSKRVPYVLRESVKKS